MVWRSAWPQTSCIQRLSCDDYIAHTGFDGSGSKIVLLSPGHGGISTTMGPLRLPASTVVERPYFGLLESTSDPRAGLPGPVWGQFWPEAQCERTKNRSRIARAFGQGSLEADLGPFASGFRQKPAQNRPKTGPGIPSRRPEVLSNDLQYSNFVERWWSGRASVGKRLRRRYMTSLALFCLGPG
jgi:hypothetical protein